MVVVVALSFFALGYVVGVRSMALTLTIGSGPIALVQKMATVTVTDWGAGYMGPITLTLPAPSTAGTALLIVLSNSYSSGALTVTMPAGWVKLISQVEGTTSNIEVWADLYNPGGIQVVNIPVAGIGIATWLTHLSEWANVASAAPLDASGSTSATSGTTLAPTTSGNVITAGDVALTAWMQRAAGAVTFTTPGGFTRLIDNGSDGTHTVHLDIEYRLNPATGAPLGPTLTSTGTTTSAVGAITVLKKAPDPVDLTAFLAYRR